MRAADLETEMEGVRKRLIVNLRMTRLEYALVDEWDVHEGPWTSDNGGITRMRLYSGQAMSMIVFTTTLQFHPLYCALWDSA